MKRLPEDDGEDRRRRSSHHGRTAADGHAPAARRARGGEDMMLDIGVELSDDTAVMRLSGSFNMENLVRVEQNLNAIIENGPRVIAIDCKGLEGIDSSAIGSLVKYFNYSMLRSIPLVICDLNPVLTRLFSTAKLNRYFTVTTREEFDRRLRSVTGMSRWSFSRRRGGNRSGGRLTG